MRKSNNNVFYGFLAVLLIGLSFGLSWLWIIPQYKENKLAASQVGYEVDAARDKLDSLKAAKQTIDSLGPIVDQMLVAVPEQKDTEGIVSTLEAIATLSGTYIPSFQISDGTVSSADAAGASANTVSVSFSVHGTFEKLSSFMESVESDLKFFNVRGVTLTSGENGMSLTLQLEAYKQTNTASLNS